MICPGYQSNSELSLGSGMEVYLLLAILVVTFTSLSKISYEISKISYEFTTGPGNDMQVFFNELSLTNL